MILTKIAHTLRHRTLAELFRCRCDPLANVVWQKSQRGVGTRKLETAENSVKAGECFAVVFEDLGIENGHDGSLFPNCDICKVTHALLQNISLPDDEQKRWEEALR